MQYIIKAIIQKVLAIFNILFLHFLWCRFSLVIPGKRYAMCLADRIISLRLSANLRNFIWKGGKEQKWFEVNINSETLDSTDKFAMFADGVRACVSTWWWRRCVHSSRPRAARLSPRRTNARLWRRTVTTRRRVWHSWDGAVLHQVGGVLDCLQEELLHWAGVQHRYHQIRIHSIMHNVLWSSQLFCLMLNWYCLTKKMYINVPYIAINSFSLLKILLGSYCPLFQIVLWPADFSTCLPVWVSVNE